MLAAGVGFHFPAGLPFPMFYMLIAVVSFALARSGAAKAATICADKSLDSSGREPHIAMIVIFTIVGAGCLIFSTVLTYKLFDKMYM